jgi:2'-5' RNA ligase
MTLSLTLSREEFAAKRRTQQAEMEEALRPHVRRAVDLRKNTDGWRELLNVTETLYREAYRQEYGETPIDYPRGFRQEMLDTLRKTKRRDAASVERIATWLATHIIAAATEQAALDDPEELALEWVTMHDDDVRHTHRAVDGVIRPIGIPFRVGGHDMMRPGDTSAPIELWINCRCTVRPTYLEEALVAAADEEKVSTLTCIVAVPNAEDAIHAIGEEEKHATVLFLGEFDGDLETVKAATEGVAASLVPFEAQVSGNGSLGPDRAKVLFVEAGGLQETRDRLLDNDLLRETHMTADTHPHFVPHVTVTYGEDAPPEVTEVASIAFDRLAVWHRGERYEYPLGGGEMTQQTDEKPVEDEAPEEKPVVEAPVEEANAVPFYSVLAPEGIKTGDGRKFREGSLTHRPLPLPLTWQKISDDGHKGNVTVAKIERVAKVGNEMRATGHFLQIPEADEVVGLVAEFGKFGVSVDADDATFEVNEDEECVEFTQARVSSACIVSIPAFAEAFVALGEAPEDWFPTEEEPAEGEVPAEVDTDHVAPEEEEDSLAASIARMRSRAEFVDTEDGPGWLTHPVDTDRLRDYWVRGPGAAKINWGTPGDFNRCRVNVAEYVKPQHINGYCANRHYDALGFWPGQRHDGETTPFAAEALGVEEDQAEALSLVAAGGGYCAPAEWFENPNLTEPTPLTVTDEGRVFGHLAEWGTCHIGFADQCVTPPESKTEYAYFLTGEVALDNGKRARCGNITIGGGHANPRLGIRAAIAHYDSTSAAVCDVTCGQDEHGIWLAGWVRPGVSDEMVTALRASGVSGDWRKVAGNLELIAALSVNVPGFPIPRPQVAASADGQISLVAAGIVQPKEEQAPATAVDVEALATRVVEMLTERQANKERMAALAMKITPLNKED